MVAADAGPVPSSGPASRPHPTTMTLKALVVARAVAWQNPRDRRLQRGEPTRYCVLLQVVWDDRARDRGRGGSGDGGGDELGEEAGELVVHSADSSGVAARGRAATCRAGRSPGRTRPAELAPQVLDRRQVAEACEVGVLDAAHLGTVRLDPPCAANEIRRIRNTPNGWLMQASPQSTSRYVGPSRSTLPSCRSSCWTVAGSGEAARVSHAAARSGSHRRARSGGRRRGPSTRRPPTRRPGNGSGRMSGTPRSSSRPWSGPASAAAGRGRSRRPPTGRTAPRGGSRGGRAAWRPHRATPTRLARAVALSVATGVSPRWARPPTGRRTFGARTPSPAPTP